MSIDFEKFKSDVLAGVRDAASLPGEPQHQHDCSKCVFLGSIGTADAYVCKTEYGASYILRYSSDGADYYSTSDFRDEKLLELKQRIGGGDELYYRRVTGIHLCATGITNLMIRGEQSRS